MQRFLEPVERVTYKQTIIVFVVTNIIVNCGISKVGPSSVAASSLGFDSTTNFACKFL